MKRFLKILSVVAMLAVIVSLVIYARGRKQTADFKTEVLYSHALDSLKLNKPDGAIKISRQILRKAPNYYDAHIVMGRAYMNKQNKNAALSSFRKALAHDSTNQDVLRYVINIEMENGNDAEALNDIDRYLARYPNDKDVLIKKYYLLLHQDRTREADEVFYTINTRFKEDTTLRDFNYEHYYSVATAHRLAGRYLAASGNYKKAIAYNTDDTLSLQQLVNLGIVTTNYRQAEAYNNKLLTIQPNEPKYLMNAAEIASYTGDKQAALDKAQKALAMAPGDAAMSAAYRDMCLRMCKDATPEEVKLYAAQALSVDPANKLALNYLVNAYVATNDYDMALRTANTALKKHPSDPELMNKKVDILYRSGDLDGAIAYLQQMMVRYKTTAHITQYAEMMQVKAKRSVDAKNYTQAEADINKGLAVDANNRQLHEQLVSVYALQGNYTDALNANEWLISRYPGNEEYLFRKAGMLEAQKEFAAASTISKQLYNKHPQSSLYKMAYVNQMLGVSKQAQETQDYASASAANREILLVDNGNYTGYLYQSNTYFGAGEADSALYSVNKGLVYFPGDSLLLVKKSTLQQMNGQHLAALHTISGLRQKYPQDEQLFNVYLDEMNNAGKYYQRNNEWDSSLQVFRHAYSFVPGDTFVLENLAAIHFVQGRYDSVVYYADKGLAHFPDNEYLLLKKTSAQEQLMDYKGAAKTARLLVRATPGNSSYRQYADLLQMKGYQNTVGVDRLQTHFPKSGVSQSITSVHYTRRFKGGSVTGRFNYANRPASSGGQAEIEAYISHGGNFYSNALVGISNTRAFPTTKVHYSLFADLGKGWEGELGGRYQRFEYDSTSIVSGVASVGKSIGNTWINLRGFVTSFNSEVYNSYLLTGRYYFNERRDYVFGTAGIGTTPDDRSLAYNYARFAGIKTQSVGVGFQKNFRHGITINGSGTFYKRSLTETTNQNQVDYNFSIMKSF